MSEIWRFFGGSGDLANARQLSHVQCRPVRVHLRRELDAVCVCVVPSEARCQTYVMSNVKQTINVNQLDLELQFMNFVAQVNLLLSAGASVNERSVDRYTPLLSACARGFGKARTKGSLD